MTTADWTILISLCSLFLSLASIALDVWWTLRRTQGDAP